MKIDEGRLSGLIALLSFALVTAILYFGRVVLMPIAVAVLLTFILAPVVIRLQRWRFPKPIAIVTTVALAFTVISFIAWLVTAQLISLLEQVPQYEQTLRAKVEQLRGAQNRPNAVRRAGEVVERLKNDLEMGATNTLQTTNLADAAEPGKTKPVPVEIKGEKSNALTLFGRVAGSFFSVLGTAGIVAVIAVFMLFQREDLRERFIGLVSGGKLNVATEAIDDAARRMSRYLGMLLIVNTTYGIPIGLGLYFIGVPNALLWGLLATLLRFIPFLGPWIAAAFPLALAFAVDPGWSKLLATLGLFLVVELISNNFVEPWLYGASTGVSNVALIIAAVFWTWLWGPVGLFLSTPLTVCLVVLGKHVPALQFLSVMLGSAPALQPHERMYQRMLAMDAEGMTALANEHLEKHELLDFYDGVLIPALNAAEEDRHHGTLAEMRQQFILENTRELIDELGRAERTKRNLTPWRQGTRRVLVVPAKDDADEVAGAILLQVLALEEIPARMMRASALPAECSDLAARANYDLICISAVPPTALYAARQVCNTLNERCQDVKTLVAIWSPKAEVTDLQQRLAAESPAAVVTTMQAAVQQTKALLGVQSGEPMTPAPIPADEAQRLGEIERLHLADREPSEMFDTVTRELSRIFDVPISLVSIVNADRQFWKSHVGLPPDLAEAQESPRETSVCGHVVAANAPIIVEDVTKDKRFANNPFLESRGIRFYAGVPLRSRAGHAVGSLCVIDVKPRQINEREVALLHMLADKLMEAVEAIPSQAA
jgi:predicted PurR-regulated permease PerM